MALQEADIHKAYYKNELRGHQAGMVLQQIYCKRVRHQLTAQEDKKGGKGKGKWMGSGNPVVLTNDTFVNLVVEHEDAAWEAEELKERGKSNREAHKTVMAAWEKKKEKTKWKNEELTWVWNKKMALWKIECNAAKAEHQAQRWNKPVQGPLFKLPPKPKKDTVVFHNIVVDDEAEVAGDDAGVEQAEAEADKEEGTIEDEEVDVNGNSDEGESEMSEKEDMSDGGWSNGGDNDGQSEVDDD